MADAPDTLQLPPTEQAPPPVEAKPSPETPEVFQQLDKMVEVKDPPKEVPKDAPKELPKDPPKDLKESPKDPAKEKNQPAPKGEKPKVEKPKEFQLLDEIPPNSPQWFRTHYDKAKGEIKRLQAELAKPKPQTPVEDPEKNQIRETLTQREKRLQELEDEIRYVDYSKSEEYKTKYHEPYVQAWNNALAEVKQLTVRNADGGERAATSEDFERLISIANPNEALRTAGELFGDPAKAAFVMTQIGTVKHAIRVAQGALNDYRTKGVERAKAQQEQYERTSKETTAKWRQLNEQTIAENPEIYQPDEGDDEGNELLAKGFERADAAFGGHITDPETKQKRAPTPDEMIAINSEIRNKAGAFDRVFHRLTKQLARVAELEQQIAEYEKSSPGNGAPPVGSPKPEVGSFDEAVDRIAAG